MLIYIASVLITGFVFCLISRKILQAVSRKRAHRSLNTLLFPHGQSQLNSTVSTIDKITRHRFKREDILDYFLKIKGLQTINLNDPIDFWTRNYLMQPTKIRLNYFEQVKFYESFLNYPEIRGRKATAASPVPVTASKINITEPIIA